MFILIFIGILMIIDLIVLVLEISNEFLEFMVFIEIGVNGVLFIWVLNDFVLGLLLLLLVLKEMLKNIFLFIYVVLILFKMVENLKFLDN